ncbi:host specificity protein J [Burkholderia sp. 22PA0099]|uniref:host specificity protein J n=1 Tax=Burkholderia sp. 22PA0099 TaxID=3237372 RepID=UPI0039C2B989
MRNRILGAKGDAGSSSSESPDSLHSTATARVLDVISEGPIIGLVDGLKSIFLDGTPIANSDGSTNFSNYSVDSRVGTQDQDYLTGFPAVENEISVGVALSSDAPWSRQLQNTQLTAVRIRFGVPALQQTNTSTGDVTGYRVEYAIDVAADGGSYSQVLAGAFDGKTTSLYERSERVELPRATSGWLVRVRRLTPNQHTNYIQDTINIEAITEIIDRKLRYPMSALVGMSFDAQSFSSVPTISYDVKGRIIAVPSNYDPDLRTYSGVWDGTFKQAWTDNPAWIFYDLVLNTRYGGGKYIDASSIDKWSLYEIAQYCDVMVPDGAGGQEPRFTCNCVIQSQSDAFKVLQDIAGIFRGQAYWGAGNVVATCDMPADAIYVYTQANVVEGKFQYAGTERKSRYTVAQVSWNDPANQYQQAVEYVSDDDGLSRYGVVKASITSFGTTSQGQAHRLGLWTLLTSRYETNTVSFDVGLDGMLCAPGDVIAVADANKAGRRIGGRIRSMDGNSVVLDKMPAVVGGDELTVIMPSGVAQKRSVAEVDGDTIKVTPAFDANAVSGAVWMLESTELASQLFRVVAVEEGDDDSQIGYTITGVQYEPGKYAAIDSGTKIQKRPVTVTPPSVQPPPSNVRVSTYSVIDQGIAKTNMVIAWDSADKAVNYIPEWRKDSGEWVRANQTGGLTIEVSGIYQGTYLARVSAQNALGVTSIPAYGIDTVLTGKTSPPPALTSLATTSQIFAIQLDWGFPADGSANDTSYIDVWYSRTNDLSAAARLSTYPYPQARASLMGLAAGQEFFFWARLVDTSGNIGPWYPADASKGVLGQSSSDATALLAMLAGEITKTQLGQDVLAPINAIPGIQQGVSSNALAITAEAQARGAAVTSEQQARQDADMALGSRIDTVSAATGSNASAIQSEARARTDQDIALGTRIDTVAAAAGANAAAISQESTARASGDAANASAIGSLTAQINVPMAGDGGGYAGSTTVYAGVWSEQSARAEADLAQSARIDTVAVQLDRAASSLSAAVQTEIRARSDAVSAQATQIGTIQAQANANAAAVQTVAQSYADLSGQVSASYTVKTQVTSGGRTYIASIGIGTDNSSGVVESSVLVAAQRFAVLDNSGSVVTSPFVVQGGQVFIAQALIGTGRITNAMIGDTIQSNNFVSGQQGWRIDKAGTFEMNGTGGGGRSTSTSDGYYVFDTNGVNRVKLGRLS